MLQWLRVEVRSSPASEEKTEFRFGADGLGADASISFIVDRLSWWWGAGLLICVCWTRVYERLRVFASVFVLSKLQFLRFA